MISILTSEPGRSFSPSSDHAKSSGTVTLSEDALKNSKGERVKSEFIAPFTIFKISVGFFGFYTRQISKTPSLKLTRVSSSLTMPPIDVELATAQKI